MRSKLSIFVAAFGSLVFFGYIYFDYEYFGNGIIGHFFPVKPTFDSFFHFIILSAFIGSIVAAYLINERKKLLDKTKRSEQQLKHAAHEWSATFDLMPYGVLLTDHDSTIIRANQYIANLSGIPAKALARKEKCYLRVCKREFGSDKCPLTKVYKSKKTENCEYYDEEHKIFFSESITPMFNEDGNIVSYVHVLVDITDTKEKEKKLTQSKDAFFSMLKDIDATYKELKNIHNSLIVTFSNIIDAKSSWTRGHSVEVANYASAIAKEMSLNELEIGMLRTAALLHDIGKIGTYDDILDKPDRLNDEEFTLIRRHTIKGEEILKPIKGLEEILPIIRSHHEKIDGTGYPDKLKADEIPFLAKILCVADSYDAMVSDRPYRPSCGRQYATAELKRCSGTQFDRDVVDAFLNSLNRTETPVS